MIADPRVTMFVRCTLLSSPRGMGGCLHDLANRVTVAHDGVEAMEYLRREGAFSEREPDEPTLKRLPVVILTSSRDEQDLIADFTDTVEQLGVFWALINERPPNGVK